MKARPITRPWTVIFSHHANPHRPWYDGAPVFQRCCRCCGAFGWDFHIHSDVYRDPHVSCTTCRQLHRMNGERLDPTHAYRDGQPMPRAPHKEDDLP